MVVTEEHEAKPLSDFVDDKVVLQKECSEEKICVICGAPNDATYRLCKVDGYIGSLVRKELNISRLHEDKEPVCLNRQFDSLVRTIMSKCLPVSQIFITQTVLKTYP